MRIAHHNLVNAGRGEDYWFFAVADPAFKTAGMPPQISCWRGPMRASNKETDQQRSSPHVGSGVLRTKNRNSVERDRSSTRNRNAGKWSGMTAHRSAGIYG